MKFAKSVLLHKKQFRGDYDNKKNTNFALDLIKSLDLENIECGTYNVNDDVLYFVQQYETNDVSESNFETHRNYIDIQYIIKGEKRIDYASLDNLTAISGYKDDIQFWTTDGDYSSMCLTVGAYGIMYPNSAHRPGVVVSDKCKVKKLVVKIKI